MSETLQQELYEMAYRSSERSDLSDVAQASVLIRELVPVTAGASVKERILKAARRLGWSYHRARDIWYEQARRIDAREMDELRRVRFQEAKKAHAELTDFIVGMETFLTAIDPDFHRDQVDALRTSRGETQTSVGSVDCARNRGEGE